MIKILKFGGAVAAVFLLLTVILCPFTLAADTKGSNVWDEELKMPSTYTWTPSIYSGLWYDFDKGVYTENITLSISANDRSIDSGNAKYDTEVKPYQFAYSDWGSYKLIAWQGDPYFAGYQRYSSGNTSTTQFANSNISTLSDQKIYKVLADSSSERRLGSGDTYSLENGYRLRVTEINESRKEFRLTLERDGSVVENRTVFENTTFVYEKEMSGIGTFPVIAVHVKTVDAGKAVIDGIFQISESSTDVSINKKINAMEIQSVNETHISMKNTDRIRLNAGSTVTFMGHMKIDVQNTSKLAFKFISDPKTDSEKKYDNRGTVYDNSTLMKNWSDLQYFGFSSDWKNESGTEELSFNVSGSIQRNVLPKEIEYHTGVFNKKFNYSDWGSYQVLHLSGVEYFAGYTQYDSSNKSNTTNFSTNNISLLFGGNVSKILINNDTNRAYSKNSTINLEEGYTLHIGNSSENESGKIDLVLKKGGSTVKEASVGNNETFVYETRIGGIDIPLIAVYVSNVSSDSIRIRGIFQISSEVTNVGVGRSMGLMQIEYISRSGLILMNKEAIDLSKGKDISLIGNLALHVADSDELRFFPYGGNSSNNDKRDLRIDVPETILPYQEITIKIFQSDGNNWREADGAVVSINGKNVGTTNSSGSVTAALQEAGVYEFRAEKSNYTAANISKATGDNGNYLNIVVPEYIFKGDIYNIQVKDNESSNIAGASIYINGSLVGETDNFGQIGLNASEIGSYLLMVSKSGYMPNSMNVTILEDAPYFVVRNIVFPESISVNKTARISVEIENVGPEKGTQTITIDGGNTSTRKYTLNAGAVQRFTINVKPNEVGMNSIVIGNQTFHYYAEESSKSEMPSWNWILLGGVGLILFAALILVTYYQETRSEKEGNRKDSRLTHEKKIGTKSEKPVSKATPSQKNSGPPKSGSHNRFSSSHKSPELKNSQKRARSKK